MAAAPLLLNRRHCLMSAAAWPLAGWANADASPVVVVGAANPLQPLSATQCVGYFTGRQRTLPNGEPVQPHDLPADHPLRERFYRLLTGLGPAQMNSYWARLRFSGQMQPPTVVDSEAAMLRVLRDNPRAIGYLGRMPEDERLRVLLVLRATGA